MAESVDALVSNTSGATHPGSIPGLGTKSLQKQQSAASTKKVKKLFRALLSAYGPQSLTATPGENHAVVFLISFLHSIGF